MRTILMFGHARGIFAPARRVGRKGLLVRKPGVAARA